jgi:hypothetical protein
MLLGSCSTALAVHANASAGALTGNSERRAPHRLQPRQVANDSGPLPEIGTQNELARTADFPAFSQAITVPVSWVVSCPSLDDPRISGVQADDVAV